MMDSTSDIQSEASSGAGGGPSVPGWLFPVGIAAITVAAFLPPLGHKEFTSPNEQSMLVANSAYQGLGIENISWAFTRSIRWGHYHPLTWLSYSADSLLYGIRARGFYLTSLLLHAGSAVLLFLIAGRLFVAARDGTPEAPGAGDGAVRLGAATAALLFAVHPLRVESVAWLVERRDVLCGLFFLGSVLCWLGSRAAMVRTDGPGSERANPAAARAWLIAAVVLGAGAILSKATAACLPLVMILLDIYPLGKSSRRVRGLRWDRIWFLTLGAIGAWTALEALKPFSQVLRVDLSFGGRLGVALQGAMALVYKTVWPVGLGPSFELPMPDLRLTDTSVLVPALIAAGISGVLALLWKRWPAGLVAWACFLVLLVPVSGLKPIGIPVAADRNSYLSCISLAVLVGAGIWSVLGRSKSLWAPIGAGAAIVVAALGTATWAQTSVWRDDMRLWTRAVELNPNDADAYNNLGTAMELKDDLEGAEEHYRRALEEDSHHDKAHYNLGTILGIRGEYEEAVEHFQTAKLFLPSDANLRQNLSNALFLLQRYDEAAAELGEVLRLTPNSARAYNDLGVIHYIHGRYDEAIENLREALELEPAFPNAHVSLADCWLAKGETNQAIAHVQEALRLAPNDAGIRQKLAGLMSQRTEETAEEEQAEAPTTAPADPRERVAAAIGRLRESLSADPGNVPAHFDLANYLSMSGQLEEAIYHYREAVRRQPTLANAYYNLTMLLTRHQRYGEAVEAAREGLSHSPEETKLMGALAWILSTNQEPEIRNLVEALELADRAVQQEPDNPSLLEVLSIVQASDGRVGEAIETLRKAEEVVESRGETVLLERLTRRREGYERRRAGNTSP